ncbi:hypothetical protein D3C85_1522190 [compost metagenome]
MAPILTTVLGADRLTGIAAIQAVTYLQHEFLFKKSLSLGKEGYAALSIQLPRTHEGTGRAGIQAFRALSAILCDRGIWRKWDVRNQFAEIDP